MDVADITILNCVNKIMKERGARFQDPGVQGETVSRSSPKTRLALSVLLVKPAYIIPNPHDFDSHPLTLHRLWLLARSQRAQPCLSKKACLTRPLINARA